MRKYYLFIIKNDAYRLYKNNPDILYQSLKSIYKLNPEKHVYGISLFNQLCDPFSVKLLKKYFTEKIPYTKISKNIIRILSFFEKTYVEIKYPTSVIITDTSYPQILKTFNIYNRRIFICDFNHDKYDWLDEITKLVGKN